MDRDIEEAKHGLKTAIETERPDVFRSILGSLKEVESTHNIEIIKPILLENICDGETLMHLATKMRQADIVRMLLTVGGNPGCLNQSGQTVLSYVTEGDPMLVVFGDELLQAVAQSNIGRVTELLEAGLSVDTRDSVVNMNTTLHWAATYADPSMTAYLCKQGASVNAENSYGQTPLHDAVRRRDVCVVEELLKNGADTSLTYIDDSKTMTVFDLAMDCPKILALLHDQTYSDHKSIELSDESPATHHRPSSIQSAVPISPLALANGPVPGSPTSPVMISPIMNKPNFTLCPPVFERATKQQCETLLWPHPQVVLKKPGDFFSVPTVLPIFVVPSSSCNTSDVLSAWNLRKGKFLSCGIEIVPGIYSVDIPTATAYISLSN